MTDAVRTYLEGQGLARIERRIPLGGRLDIGGESAAPFICVTRLGPLLVGALADGRGRHVRLGDGARVKYVRGRLRSTLEVDGMAFAVPLSQRTSLERALALAQVAPLSAAPPRELPQGPWIERPGEVERAWLAASLAADEDLLGWVRSVTRTPIASPMGGSLTGRWRLMLTSRRTALVALSVLADALVREVATVDLPDLGAGLGRLELTLSDVDLVFHRSSADLARAALAAARSPLPVRRLEAARRAWVTRRPELIPFARHLLETGSAAGDPLAAIADLLVSAERGVPPAGNMELAAALSQLAHDEVPAAALAELARDFRCSRLATRALLDDLRSHGVRGEPWALHLHRFLHDAPPESADSIRSTLADLDFAEHSLTADLRPLAVEVLETRLSHLPSETLQELLPPRDADLTAGAGGPTLRSRVFELLAKARGTPEAPDLRAIAELARLHPLVAERVRALADVATGELHERALAVDRALVAGGLAPREPPPEAPSSRGRPLTEKLLDEVVRHPATRRDSPLVARVQTLLASVPVPEVSFLRDYCETLTAPPHDAAVRAFQFAATSLGVCDVDAYISRGAKGVGVRAYEGRPPFVLIGGQHLGAGEFRLSEPELRFAFGAELAHLRFGHSRVTSSDLWAGALDKGKQGVELALGMVPVFRGWALADKAVRATSLVPIPVVQRVVGAAQHWQQRVIATALRPVSAPTEDGLSTLNETLLVAHRMMQLSADRAGLVISGDVQASLRVMFLLRRDYRAELAVVEEKGLATVLGQRAEDGHLAYQDLAVRVAALLAFYLSDEYVRLRAALVG